MTVSRVLNDHPSVRPNTRKKVESAIAKLGYRQNEAARLLKGQRAREIGIILPDLSDTFFAACAHTIQQIARGHGYTTLVASSERDSEIEIREAEIMASRMASGLLIVTSSSRTDDRLNQLQETGLHIVAFDRPIKGIRADCVLVENRSGAEEATQHLLDHGHKQIACIGYDQDTYTVQERIEGYINLLRANRLKPQMALGLTTVAQTREWLFSSLKTKTPPTAIFALNHRTAVHLLLVLNELKLRIPEDISVVGFDDFELAAALKPALTTVAQSPVELARRAMGLLMDRINGVRLTDDETPAKVILPVKLMIRNSCGPHETS
jgi:LacI family transcriptional regulator